MDEEEPIRYSEAEWRPDQEEDIIADDVIKEIRSQKEEEPAFKKIVRKYGLKKIIFTILLILVSLLLIYLVVDHIIKMQTFDEYKYRTIDDYLKNHNSTYVVKDMVDVMGVVESIADEGDHSCVYVSNDDQENICLMIYDSIDEFKDKIGFQIDARCEHIGKTHCKVYSLSAVTFIQGGYLGDQI